MRETKEVLDLVNAFNLTKTADNKENTDVGDYVKQALEELSKLNPKDLPQTITAQFDKLEELEKRVTEAKSNATEAKEKAESAKEMSAGLFKKKAAIESLQEVADDLATAQGSIVDALDSSFDYQQQLGQITQFLFILGVSNIAATRSIVQQLKNELKKSSSKLSDLAKTEILSIIKQLEAQEDMANKLENHADAIRDNKASIREGEKKDIEQDLLIGENSSKNQEQDFRIDENKTLNIKQEKQIEALTKKCKELSAELEDLKKALSNITSSSQKKSGSLFPCYVGIAVALLLALIGLFL